MIRNYFKIAWRNILKSKFFSILNIIGLSTGMACSMLILLWVQNEVNYDKFHTDSQRIYRFIVGSGDFKTAVSSAGMGPDLKEELPEIEAVVRTTKQEKALFNVDNKVFEEDLFMYVDPDFLVFFDFPLLYGKKDLALKEPNTILLTAAMAKKLFGEENVLGKTIKINNSKDFKITGVLKDLPPNSHLNFNVISSTMTIAKTNGDFANKTWGQFNYYSYFKLNEHISASKIALSSLENKINTIASERLSNKTFDFRLQPLEDIHLHSDLQLDVAGHGNNEYVSIFFFVGLFILVVACINFMNLSTARSAKRSKEVGVRKAIGAHRSQLIGQFLSESILLSVLSLIIAIGLVFIALPYFNGISGKVLSIDITKSDFWLSTMGIVLVTGVVSGCYPALYLSGFNPVKVLKGSLKTTSSNLFLRNGLVTMQFVISTVLIVGTGVVYNQLNFIKDKNLGFDKSNMIIVPLRGDIGKKQDALKASLQNTPLLANYSMFTDMPTNLDTGTIDVDWEGKEQNNGLVVPCLRIDDRFISLFDIEVLAGRGFSENFPINDKNFVINETLMKLMGKNLDNIIGQKFELNDIHGHIVGVVKDFHFKPLQYNIEPLVLNQRNNPAFLAIRTNIAQTTSSLTALESIHSKLNPAFPFSYSFLDADLENLYKGEQQMGTIFNILALLAIFISCLGIYGLSAFMAEQRIKEIGVRKVLGATTTNLVNLLSKDFLKLVVLALFISIPISWYYLNDWLLTFAYHINISLWMFLGAGAVIVLITLFTSSYHSIRAAITNPIKSIRTE